MRGFLAGLRLLVVVVFALLVLPADNLVVELDVDVGVFVPTYLVETVAVELVETGQFGVEELVDVALAANLVRPFRQLSQAHHVSSDTGHYFQAFVGKHVELHNLVAPQFMVGNPLCHHLDVVLGIPIADIAGGDNEVGGVGAIVSEGDETIRKMADSVIELPHTEECLEPLLASIPLQMLAYYIAVAKGKDVDQPRNLAKSVTVE